MPKILCIGGTGTVGRLVVEGLVARGVSVRCMTRSVDPGEANHGRIEFRAGDLENPASLDPVFDGVDRLHLLTPLHPREAELGKAALEAAQRAGVERIVLHSVHRADHAPQVPHFQSKMEILEAIQRSGIPWTSIEPNTYFQNDLWLRDTITLHGVYPQPLGSIGANRVDVRDIADATVNALLDDGHAGSRVPLVGPHGLTGEHCARIWAAALDRTVEYVGDDLDAWEESALTMMPEWMVADLRVMFEHFAAVGLRGTEEDFASMSHVLGHAPRTFHDFVMETVVAWDTTETMGTAAGRR